MSKPVWIIVMIACVLTLAFTIWDVIAEYAGFTGACFAVGIVAASVAGVAYWGYDQFYKIKPTK